MAERNDFFQKKMSNTRAFKRQSSHSYTWIRIVLGILILLGGGFLGYRIFFAPANLSNVSENTSQFSLGQEITLQGTLKADGDILTHTHTLTTETYGIIGVKSKNINLGEYEGFVETIGIVEKFYQGDPIVEITALSGQKV
ncbi:hypothetical protein FACS1894176_04770 [Bacteroidia bacterium]|nr:hypothetical protein FACS1894176_04770 [Bacteroidia bacterium]